MSAIFFFLRPCFFLRFGNITGGCSDMDWILASQETYLKKKNMVLNQKITPIFQISPLFHIFLLIFFLTICLILGFPPPLKPRFAKGPPLSFSIKNKEKIGFHTFKMPTAKNRFHILNLHPKNMYLKKKSPKNMVLKEKWY